MATLQELPPELRIPVLHTLKALEPLPKDLAVVVLAITYLLTLPKERRLALATVILERVMEA